MRTQKAEHGCPAGFVGLLRKSEFICILIIFGCAFDVRAERNRRSVDSFQRILFYVSSRFSFFLGPGALGRLLESTLSPTSSSASFSTGPCHSLLHPSKLTRLLGSPGTRHLTDLPTVSPPHITPSLSALKTPL